MENLIVELVGRIVRIERSIERLRVMARGGSGGSHAVLGASHTDALAGAVVAGDVIIGNATPKWSRLAAGTEGQVLRMGASLPAWSSAFMWHTIVFTMEGDLAVGADPIRWYAPGPMTIDRVYISVDTVPTGAGSAVTVDIHKNGVTIFTDQGKRPSIVVSPAADETDNSDVPDITALVLNDRLTMEVDAVGGTVPGANLTVHVRCKQYLQV